MTSFTKKRMPSSKIIGLPLRCKVDHSKENPIPSFWGTCFKDGSVAKLEALEGRLEKNALLGWCGEYNPEDHNFTYVIGILAEENTIAPAGMKEISLPESDFAVATFEGIEPDIFRHAHELAFDELKKAGLEYDPTRGCEIEWYDERFCKDENKKVIDLYIPIKS
jgi:predicted transcriptional regulator YdeE